MNIGAFKKGKATILANRNAPEVTVTFVVLYVLLGEPVWPESSLVRHRLILHFAELVVQEEKSLHGMLPIFSLDYIPMSFRTCP